MARPLNGKRELSDEASEVILDNVICRGFDVMLLKLCEAELWLCRLRSYFSAENFIVKIWFSINIERVFAS
jgi:hypothetical protein